MNKGELFLGYYKPEIDELDKSTLWLMSAKGTATTVSNVDRSSYSWPSAWGSDTSFKRVLV